MSQRNPAISKGIDWSLVWLCLTVISSWYHGDIWRYLS